MNTLNLIDDWYDLRDREENLDDFCQLKSITLTRNEKIDLLSKMVGKDVFRYSTLLTNSLPLVADADDDFLNLLESIVKSTQGDLAIGWFETALIEIGKKNPELGISLAIKMKQNENLLNFSSCPLGGVGRNDYNKIKEIVNESLSSNNTQEIINGLRTIRISYKNKHLNNKTEIFSKFEEAKKIGIDDINFEVTAGFLEFYEQDPTLCHKHLLELAKINDKIKAIISQHIWIHPIEDAARALELLQECYKAINKNVKRSVFYALTKYSKTQHKEIMAIIRAELENKAQPYGDLEYLITELGKNALIDSLNDFEDWLDTNNFHLKFSIPRFVALLIPEGQRQSCFSYFEKWSQKKSISDDLFLKIYRRVLARCYGNTLDQEFVKNSKILLSKLLNQSGINPSFFIKNESDETLQCACIIKGLEFYSNDLDYDKILLHLDFFPNLKDLLTTKWVLKKKKENNRTNLLLRVLEREFPNQAKINEILQAMEKAKDEQEHGWQKFRLGNHVHDYLYILNIEQNILNFKNSNLNVNTHFRNKLQNDEQVDDAISEINILGTLVKHYELKLETPVGKKNIDSLIEIDGQKLYLEVINPTEYSPVDLFEGEVFTVPHRAKNKILDKCEKQFSEIPEPDTPVILAIDTHRTDIDSDSIEDALSGSLQYTFLMDKKSGEDKGGYLSRKDNSIHKSKSGSDVLSAVLCFKSDLLTDMRFHITGKLIHNPNAKNPLIEHIVKRIEEIILKK